MPKSTAPWTRLNMDIRERLKTTKKRNEHLIVITDDFSKYTIAIHIKFTKSEIIINTPFISVFAVFSYPEAIRLNNVLCFSSSEFINYMQNSRIQLIKPAAYNHDSNGEVEIFNRTLNETLACYEVDDNWDLISPIITHTYNNQPHSITKAVPYEVMFGKKKMTIERNLGLLNHLNNNELSIRHENLIAEVLEILTKEQKKKLTCKPKFFKEGDIVLKKILNAVGNKGKLAEKYEGPYIIVSIDDTTSNCKLTKITKRGRLSHFGSKGNRIYKVAHVKQLKMYKHSSGDEKGSNQAGEGVRRNAN
uniref:Integrase catalytic domain-containing protein n=1 Tax=Strongyloides papillosus TaxID=174720 RepID=A0A0N5BIP1_STREA